jgi:hypothetical protein
MVRRECIRQVEYVLIIRVELAQCEGWMFWSQALGIESAGGGYIVEYIFFIMFSVSIWCLEHWEY